MRLKVDVNNDALYFRLDESTIVESEEIRPGIIVDYASNGDVVGVEMLQISKRAPVEKLRTLLFETV